MRICIKFRIIDGVIFVPFIPWSRELKWGQMKRDIKRKNEQKNLDQKSSQK